MQPFVELFPALNSPTPPAGTRPGWASGPDTFDQREQVPVFIWGGYQYWTFDHNDNRNAFTIVAYDHNRNIVKQWEKRGPRYIWDVTLDRTNRTLTFWGQGNEKLNVTLDELCITDMQRYTLNPPPEINFIPVLQAPVVPAGLASFWQLDQRDTTNGTGIPVIKWEGYIYFTYVFPDNRMSFAIVAFNKDGKIVKDWEIHGVRYITEMAVDLPNKRVNFTGQGPKTITCTWDDLKISEADLKNNNFDKFAQMEVKEMLIKAAPPMPAEVESRWADGPDGRIDHKKCQVLSYLGYTYWIFDYRGNANSVGITAYNSEGKPVKHWKKDGVRYLWSILLDPRRKTVTFWGQANSNVTMGWDELKV